MTKLITSFAVAMMLTGATSAMANNRADRYWIDQSRPCGGYSCDSQSGARAFLDYQQDHGH